MESTAQLQDGVASLRSGRRQVQLAQRLIERDKPGTKQSRISEYLEAALDDFDVSEEQLMSGLDALPERPAAAPLLSLAEPVRPTPLASVVDLPAPRVLPLATPDAEEPEEDAMEKGGKPSLKEDLAHLLTATREVLPHLEAMKRVRAEQGRPMSPDRLDQVDQFMGEMNALMDRLSALKADQAARAQQDAEQQELQEMAERFKRFGISA